MTASVRPPLHDVAAETWVPCACGQLYCPSDPASWEEHKNHQ